MLKKIKYYLPMIALIVMILGVSYIGALDEKKTASQVEYKSANSQQQNVYLNK